MPQATTGLIVNNIASPATTLEVAFSNDDLAATATIEIEVFVVFGTLATKVGVAHQVFTLPPLTTNIRTFNITGALAFEFQADIPVGGTNTSINVFSKDASNNLIAAQRVLNSEPTGIATLTPIP
jgi:hypothetical protein